MKNLLYYPGFDIRDESWLKFALLYIEKLRPIIPESGDAYISNFSKHIYDESDLLEKFRPENSNASYKASLDAIEIIEKILENPKRYSQIFRTSQIDEVWRNKEQYTFSLFREKYTYDFERFLIENKLVVESDKGVFLSKGIAFLYMSLFSHAISDAHSISPITDLPEMDKFSIFLRHSKETDKEKFILANKIIALKLPEKIEKIPIQSILELRRSNDYKVKLRAFNKSLNEFLEEDDEDKSEENFIKKHKYIYNEFNIELLKFGLGLASFSVGVWITTKSPELKESEIVKSLLDGGICLLSGISINQSWRNTKTKRYCKKYLADISKVKK